MTQFARPTSDTINGGNWTANAWSLMDETSPSDADFASSVAVSSGSTATLEVTLSAVTDPNVDTGHVLHIRAAKNNTNRTLVGNYALYDGATPIETGQLNGGAGLSTTFTTYSISLNSSNIANILTASYNGSLRIRFSGTVSGGSSGTTGMRVSWAALEVPVRSSLRVPYAQILGDSYNIPSTGSGATSAAESWVVQMETLHGNAATPWDNWARGGVSIGQVGYTPSGESVNFGTAYWVMRTFVPPATAPYDAQNGPLVYAAGLNDFNQSSGQTAVPMATTLEELVSAIAHLRARGQYEDNNTAVFGASPPAGYTRSAATDRNSGTTYTASTALATAPVSMTLPADYDGTRVGIRFIGRDGVTPAGATWTIKVNGTTHGTHDSRGASASASLQRFRRSTYFIDNPVAGDVITAEQTAFFGAFAGIDALVFEGSDAPLVLVRIVPRLPTAGYSAMGGGSANFGDTEVNSWNTLLATVPGRFPYDAVRIVDVSSMHGVTAQFEASGVHPSDLGHDTITTATETTLFQGFAQDRVTVSDSASRVVSLVRGTSDSVTISDLVSRAAGKARATSDTVSVSDSLARGTGVARATSDTVTVSDTVARSVGRGRSTTDTVSISDSPTRVVALPRATSDVVAVTDAAARSVGTVRSTSDSLTVSDSLAVSKGVSRTASDTVNVTDAVTRAPMSFTRAAGDTVTITDLPARTLSVSRTASDIVGISDGITTAQGRVRATFDTVTLADNAARILSRHLSASDAISVTDAVTFTLDIAPVAAGSSGTLGPTGTSGRLVQPRSGSVT